MPIDELVRRRVHGLDLWSGEPLEGEDADDWLRNEYRKFEVPRALTEVEQREVLQLFAEFSWYIE